MVLLCMIAMLSVLVARKGRSRGLFWPLQSRYFFVLPVALIGLIALSMVGCASRTPTAPTPGAAASPEMKEAEAPTVPAAAATPAVPPASGQIAWHSERSGSLQIWVMDDNGENQRQITVGDGIGTNVEPSWSPDCQQIAFVTDRRLQ